jgi:hypothetical protein
VRAPHKFTLSADEREHIEMLVNTGRAAMRLLDHVATHTRATDRGLLNGMPLEIALKCQTWQDVPGAHLGDLFHYGVRRKQLMFDYLLTVKP